VLHFLIVSHTLTIRITDELARWLKEMARRTGIPAGRIVREQLERAKSESSGQEKPFMRFAGIVEGPSNLSRRKGFSRK
jgi:predicted transcriptional regulator